jgi:opacity protein-like surface antigen
MKRSMMTVAALALVVGASSANAQARKAPMAKPQAAAAKSISFGVSAGAAIPTGDMGDGFNTGFGLTGLADMKTSMPVNFRGELSFNRFGAKDMPAGIDGHSRILAGIVNAVWSVPTSGGIQPYFLGGPGVYSLKTTVSDGDADLSVSKTAMGINGGMGLNFHVGTLSSFAEIRYHNVFSKDDDKGFTNTQTIPLSFGIRF